MFCPFFFFSSRRRHTRCLSDWSSDVCSSDLLTPVAEFRVNTGRGGFLRARRTATETAAATATDGLPHRRRSEERRVGKEGRARWSPDASKERRQCTVWTKERGSQWTDDAKLM